MDPLLERIDLFTAFIRRRTGDGELAAEVVQESLAKAVATAGSLRDSQRIVPWFWQIVRNTLADAMSRRRRSEPLREQPDSEAMASGMLCACLSAALSDLPARQRTAITLIELEGKDPAEAAAALGISAINLKVIRHRGRMALRKRLESVCQACAGRSCVDCDCKPSDPPQSARTPEQRLSATAARPPAPPAPVLIDRMAGPGPPWPERDTIRRA